MKSLAIQQELRPALPNIFFNVDYHEFRQTLIQIDEILERSGLENQILDKAVEQWILLKHLDESKFVQSKSCQKLWKKLQFALRCNISRHLTGESFRQFSTRLSDSQLFQWFTRIHFLTNKKAVSKSSLDRFDKLFNEKAVGEVLRQWQGSFLTDQESVEKIGLNHAMDCRDIFTDGTCIKANIHFPADWVLLRDAAKSLLLAIQTIRRQGLKHRMIEPSQLMKQMNRMCIEMTHTRRKKDSRKARKKILRKMKKLSHCIRNHAQKYRDLLIKDREKTSWSEDQANMVLNRIKNILDQLPGAIKQAHERIIGERSLKSKDKILSLYEPDVHVIVRGKSGNEVEFGNGLILTEQRDGLILDWECFKDQPKSDAKLLKTVMTRTQKYHGVIRSATADRGFNSKENDQFLAQKNIYNATCPRSPKQLTERMKETKFRELQTRRSQTEGRIGIFKNNFLGRPLRSKGFTNKAMSVTWCVLTHNLWLIARMALSDKNHHLEKAA